MQAGAVAPAAPAVAAAPGKNDELVPNLNNYVRGKLSRTEVLTFADCARALGEAQSCSSWDRACRQHQLQLPQLQGLCPVQQHCIKAASTVMSEACSSIPPSSCSTLRSCSVIICDSLTRTCKQQQCVPSHMALACFDLPLAALPACKTTVRAARYHTVSSMSTVFSLLWAALCLL
jgi:hypothetical protein